MGDTCNNLSTENITSKTERASNGKKCLGEYKVKQLENEAAAKRA